MVDEAMTLAIVMTDTVVHCNCYDNSDVTTKRRQAALRARLFADCVGVCDRVIVNGLVYCTRQRRIS